MDHRHLYSVEKMCKVFQISRSSYYAWTKRSGSMLKRDVIRSCVRASFKKNKEHYGSPRLVREMRDQGHQVSRSTAARVMKEERLIARPRAKYVHTTDSDHSHRVAPNLLNREFDASAPNEKWVSDITYIRTRQGWAYLTIILDLADRMVVSWHLSSDLSCENTTLKTFRKALEKRTINKPLIFHSDRGIQYCASIFVDELKRNRFIKQSMSRKANCWDNAVAESFFKTLKIECIHQFSYQNIQQANASIFDYIERWYNTRRRHSAIGYISPLQKYNLFFNRNVA